MWLSATKRNRPAIGAQNLTTNAITATRQTFSSGTRLHSRLKEPRTHGGKGPNLIDERSAPAVTAEDPLQMRASHQQRGSATHRSADLSVIHQPSMRSAQITIIVLPLFQDSMTCPSPLSSSQTFVGLRMNDFCMTLSYLKNRTTHQKSYPTPCGASYLCCTIGPLRTRV